MCFRGVFMNALKNKLRKNENITINFVGDSVTYCLDHCRPEETYVAKFAALLAQRLTDYTVHRYDGLAPEDPLKPIKVFDGPILVKNGTNGTVSVIRNGVCGNTTSFAHNRIENFTGVTPSGDRADVIFFMFGINDALKADPLKYVEPDIFKKNYKSLLDDVRSRDPQALLVMINATTNDQCIDAHCERAEELAKEEGILFIDAHRLWNEHYREGMPNFGQGDWLSSRRVDACHPTPVSAEATAKFIFDEFISVLDM